ncbi:MAG: EamA family transporter [Dehalococcoidia bacterium]|nr:EamA family transporter [Dehalococcoidia bacterium]
MEFSDDLLAALLSIVASVAFAGSSVFFFRGTRHAHNWVGILCSVLLGPPVFLVMALGTGEFGELGAVSGLFILFMASAGVLHFVVGRALYFGSIRAIGASRSSIAIGAVPFFSVLFAVLLLDETMSVAIALGGFLVLLGPLLISQGRASGNAAFPISPAQLRTGVLLGLGTSVLWGTSPVMISAGLDENDLPVAGGLVSYAAAGSALLVAFVVSPGAREKAAAPDRRGVLWYLLSAACVTVAQFLTFLALSLGSVTVVILLQQTSPIFVLLLTFLVSRHLEVPNATVIAGSIIVVTGAAIVVASS